MDIFFADDSIQRGAREGMDRVIALGGVCVPEAELRPLEVAIGQLGAEFGLPEGEELKWSPNRRTWVHENLRDQRRHDCYERILRAAQEHQTRAIVVCFDLARVTMTEEGAKQLCLKYLFERIHNDLNNRGARGIVVADRPGGGRGEEAAFLVEFLEHQQRGTPYVVPENIVLNVVTTPSHHMKLLQLADLVTGITTAMVCGQYQYARPLFPVIREMLVRGNSGTINGSGLKLFPSDISNIYHWVLGENAIVRGGGAIGWRIPSERLIYADDEFRERTT